MNRRFSIGAVAVAVLVLLAGCSAPLQTTDGDQSSGEVTESQRTISTTGTGEVSADTDRAVVTVAVTARADGAEAAREAVAENASRMREALRNAGVDDDEVTTAFYRVRPITDAPREPAEGDEREIVGYEAVHAYEIETTPDAAGTVVDAAVGNGASEVRGVTFTLSDETREELRQQALERAMSDARADADTIAAAADLTVTGVHSASTNDGYGPVYETRDVAADSAGGAPTQFDAGTVTVSATVDVTYTAAAE